MFLSSTSNIPDQRADIPAFHLADQTHLGLMEYWTGGGVLVHRTGYVVATDAVGNVDAAFDPLIETLNRRRGLVFACGMEAPGRYRRQVMGFVDPPLAITARDRAMQITALNRRGLPLLAVIVSALQGHPHVLAMTATTDRASLVIAEPDGPFAEEERSRQASVFSVLRVITALLSTDSDPLLGLFGAFGYDLAYQFEPITRRLPRAADQRDLVLYLPDQLLVGDPNSGVLRRFDYDFTVEIEGGARSSTGIARDGVDCAYVPEPPDGLIAGSDHREGAYEAVVRQAIAAFRRGDLFEVVPGQTFTEPCRDLPSAVFRRLRASNPAPYEAMINLGDGEFLVAASPEMFVRVKNGRVETCPISGTAARGADALVDAERILSLLSSAKEKAELTMCTDVDRNDKARVCKPGSIRVLGRRMIEMYSRLIHTVDHVEGQLRDGFDALDAFLTHGWAVTVTGAPKRGAMRFIEQHEKTPRLWYGGAFGRIGFDGSLDSGLTLRTIRLKAGVATVRAGATLLVDSDPAAENMECRLKASAFRDAIHGRRPNHTGVSDASDGPLDGQGRHVLLIDHDDSFVHMLADYFRRTGATVSTMRHTHAQAALSAGPAPDLVVLSPGPGYPDDFAMRRTLDTALARQIPVFGVCLGLQGMVEYFGGHLDRLAEPMHGKPSEISVLGGQLFRNLPDRFSVGRYHSMVANRQSLPDCLTITAETADGLVMAIEHRELPLVAVQFHPESIMTLVDDIGPDLIRAVMRCFAGKKPEAAVRRSQGNDRLNLVRVA